MGSGKHRWKISIYRSTSTPTKPETRPDIPPTEFICPISGSLMADPVIVSTGQTFERACVTACKNLGFTPTLNDGSTPDFSMVIPNLALKTSIFNWAKLSLSSPPTPLELADALKLLESLMAETKENGEISGELLRRVDDPGSNLLEHSESELTRRQTRFDSGESLSGSFRRTPFVLATRPSCYSSCSSSSEFELSESGSCVDEGYVSKLRSQHVYEQEEGLVALRKTTRSSVVSLVSLCTPRLLSALRSLITSKYTDIQVNSVAILVNLSLEKVNKVKIVRAGFVPPLIDVLRGRSPEAQEHACGALFSLALDDGNKTAIGVLGALQPLVHMLMRSESERARHDAALALYHLSLVQSNRLKLVKFGSVQLLLGMVKSGQMPGRALIILCNLGACNEGRAAMLDAGAVEFLIELLRKGEFDSESTQESCVAALYALGHGGALRFRGLAKVAGAMDVLKVVIEKNNRERAKEKARRIIELLKAKEEEEEEVDWEKVLETGFQSRAITRPGGQSCRNSTEF
ncbi:U-box domain-containing protein 40-like [Chenopodium quinoa]|uniref:RING-type E3 ubiquitin transferase n=1 Tax=Chenopodium quinoa TaxID=63459 RepID=A0A803MMB8_CHEQI|nr:U-box domain-containing protein 40-like [Chenopodium quinoa]